MSNGNAAPNIFMKVAGVTGESTNAQYPGWTDLLSIDAGLKNDRTHEKSGPSKSSASDVSCTAYMDKATSGLMQKCALGSNVPKVEFAFIKMGGEQAEYMRLTIEDVYVTQVQMASGRGEHPIFNYSFNFARMKIDYKPQTERGSPGGGTSATWDINQNKP
jgi:type VI secretion system secreted protein Hcp